MGVSSSHRGMATSTIGECKETPWYATSNASIHSEGYYTNASKSFHNRPKNSMQYAVCSMTDHHSLLASWLHAFPAESSYRIFASSIVPVPFLFGLRPSSAIWLQILLCRFSQRLCRSSISVSDGRQLLFKIRRIASGETLNCAARTGVVNSVGFIAWRCRIPSTASGESFFCGFHPPLNFSCNASFWTCHPSRFFFF